MKKILCAILLLSCLLCVCSCDAVDKVKDKITGGGDDETVEVDAFTKFENAIAAASASAVEVDVVTVTALGELKSSYEIVYSADNSAVINYSYERFYEFGEGPADEIKETVSGTVYRDKDGNFTPATGVDLSAVTAAGAYDISRFKSTATINEAGDRLTVKVPKTSTETVFGSEFSSDVDFEMILVGDKLASMMLTYNGGKISYNYSAN